ncbi:kinesin [Trichoderma arundinaceum]|uniref:Kinesin n=1 Tax=Trichoderma arundinaceum TaxID=490622 RepID=A0A395NT60_TRIAR|nr:kinesin [Trichoderma arundinaceum]
MPATPFQIEAWTEYAIGTAIILARIACRCSTVGLNWEGDDYFAVIAVFFWTVRAPQWTEKGVCAESANARIGRAVYARVNRLVFP